MDIQIGKIVFIQAANGACSRTKNRVANHGSQGFEIKRFNPGSWQFGGAPAVLLESVSKTAKGGEPWFGWLPLQEVMEAQ